MTDLEPTIPLEELGNDETAKSNEMLMDKVADLEAYNERLLNGDIEKHNKIVSLVIENEALKARVEKQNADILALKILTERQRLKIDTLEGQTPWKDIKDKSEVIRRLTKAKEIIEKLLNVFASKLA